MAISDHVSSELLATPTRRRALGSLRTLCSDRRICIDGFLPSERELAERIGVSRPTLRKILEQMEREGLVRSNSMGRRFTERAEELWGGREGESVLARSVVLLTEQTMTKQHAGQQASGWDHQTTLGSIAALQEQGLTAMIIPPQDYDGERGKWIVDASPRGILAPVLSRNRAGRHHLLAQALRRNLPMVIRSEDQDCVQADAVGADHEAGAYELTRLLIARGRKAIWMLWNSRRDTDKNQEQAGWIQQRRAGCERALREEGLRPPVELSMDSEGITGLSARTFEKGARLVAGYLAEGLAQGQPMDALMVCSDGPVGRTMAALRLLGQVPNETVDVVGYDNYWPETIDRRHDPTPPIATVDKPNRCIGRAMAEMLEQRVAGLLPDEPQVRLVAPKLIFPDAADCGRRAALPDC